MCLVLYIGSHVALPEIPEVAREASLLVVRGLDATEGAVRHHFSQPCVYFVGAHTGCSCGFAFGADAENSEQSVASVQRLRAYLSAALNLSPTIELYSCWHGDEAEAAVSREVIDLDWLNGESGEFEFPERWFGKLSLMSDREHR
jgi:hypothetical protein